MTAWLALAASAGTLAVEHRGEITGDGLRWQTEAVTTGGEVALAVPIPEPQVLRLQGARPIVSEGALVGWSGEPRVVLETSQPDQDRLRPPLVLDPDAPQEIVVKGQSFTPESALGFVRHVGWTGEPGVGEKERWRLRQHFGMGVRHLGAIVLVAEAPLPEGLPGALRPTGARSGLAVAGALLASIAAVAGLVLAYRRLERSARRERLAEWMSTL